MTEPYVHSSSAFVPPYGFVSIAVLKRGLQALGHTESNTCRACVQGFPRWCRCGGVQHGTFYANPQIRYPQFACATCGFCR